MGLQVFIIVFDTVQVIDSKFKLPKARHCLFSDNTLNVIIPLFFKVLHFYAYLNNFVYLMKKIYCKGMKIPSGQCKKKRGSSNSKLRPPPVLVRNLILYTHSYTRLQKGLPSQLQAPLTIL